MDPLHATIEEFARRGFYARRVLLPAMSRDAGLSVIRVAGCLAKIAISSGLGLRVRRHTVFEKANFDLVNDVF